VTTRVSYQRFYAPIRLTGVSIGYQRYYVPLVPAFGVEVSYQRFYVPLVPAFGVEVSYQRFYVPLLGGDVGRRRGFMNFNPHQS
jgi:hypothetical protein